mmetsp:Transcript_71590/g.149676  ORF Transcript_71590/g.149676 Transcript_71590/m.149676 type:complete len:217 (+) Transcript_71590:1548-2198(+)
MSSYPKPSAKARFEFFEMFRSPNFRSERCFPETAPVPPDFRAGVGPVTPSSDSESETAALCLPFFPPFPFPFVGHSSPFSPLLLRSFPLGFPPSSWSLPLWLPFPFDLSSCLPLPPLESSSSGFPLFPLPPANSSKVSTLMVFPFPPLGSSKLSNRLLLPFPDLESLPKSSCLPILPLPPLKLSPKSSNLPVLPLPPLRSSPKLLWLPLPPLKLSS